MRKRSKPVHIYLLGRGIADGVSQMTAEALAAIRKSRLVFDLSGDVRAIRKLHPNVVDLASDYWTGELCDNIYDRLQEMLLDEAKTNGPTISVVVDGHPMVFDDVNWGIVRAGRKRGLNVVALPGISCVDPMMVRLGTLDDARAFLHRHQDDGLTMHIPAYPRAPVNEAFTRAIDDERHLAEIALV